MLLCSRSFLPTAGGSNSHRPGASAARVRRRAEARQIPVMCSSGSRRLGSGARCVESTLVGVQLRTHWHPLSPCSAPQFPARARQQCAATKSSEAPARSPEEKTRIREKVIFSKWLRKNSC